MNRDRNIRNGLIRLGLEIRLDLDLDLDETVFNVRWLMNGMWIDDRLVRVDRKRKERSSTERLLAWIGVLMVLIIPFSLLSEKIVKIMGLDNHIRFTQETRAAFDLRESIQKLNSALTTLQYARHREIRKVPIRNCMRRCQRKDNIHDNTVIEEYIIFTGPWMIGPTLTVLPPRTHQRVRTKMP